MKLPSSKSAPTSFVIPGCSFPLAIEVPATAIFSVHLPESIPYTDDSSEAGKDQKTDCRQEVLETATSLLYAPNADNEVCRLVLRDGTSRTVRAQELASGRLIEQVSVAIRQRAFRRHLRGESIGVCPADAAEAVADALGQLSTTLSIHNAQAYLEDLPQDIDVVSVEPLRARPARRRRYLNG
jgi:hypothetical protein